MQNHYDCIVVGAGPAGSTVATLVAEAGIETLLLERETIPRFHVGESLMPETYWTLQRLGVLERMKSSQFVPKKSVQFVAADGRESQPFFFRDHDPRECSQTWQVERADFDHMLFVNASEKGADCHDSTRVIDILGEQNCARGVRLQTAAGQRREITSRLVVDATGQQALIASKLGLRENNPKLRKAAIWSYFQGGRRDEGENAGATIILHTRSKQTWFWYIPLSRNIVSVGVVGDNDLLLSGRGSAEQVFQQELASCNGVTERLEQAQRVDNFHIAKEFSYTTTQQAGDGWILIGDAMGFVDPIYSSGVFFALKSGELAADCIVQAIRSGDLSASQLGRWTGPFNEGTRWIRKLVDAFYTEPFSMGKFMKMHPQHRGNLTNLLIGRIFDDSAGELFDDLDVWLEGLD